VSFLVETTNEKSQLPLRPKPHQREKEMVLYGEEPNLKRTGKRKVGHPTQFDTLLEMAKISWAPVLECLSLLDSKKYNSVEELPLPTEKPYSVNLGKKVIEIEKMHPHKKIRWISGGEIKKIHDDLINTFGGELGIADETQLEAIIDRAQNSKIFGHDPLETVVHKAAFLMHSLLRYHQFVDGQKRTGVSTAFIFLGLNGYSFWSRDVLAEVHYCIETAQGEHDVDDITDWLSDRIWTRNIAKEKETINLFVEKKGFKAQCTNPKCRTMMRLKSYRTKCPKCGREYELKITHVVRTYGIKSHVTFNVSLHKLEDSELVTSGVISINRENGEEKL
jgi:death-on-curing protein